MIFGNLKTRLAENFKTALETSTLFEVAIDKDALWNLYLDSFPEGTNSMYRKRR